MILDESINYCGGLFKLYKDIKAKSYFKKIKEASDIEPKARTHFLNTLNEYNEGHKDLTNENVSISFIPYGIYGETVVMEINGDSFRPLAITLFARELGLKVVDHVRIVREVIQSDYYKPCSKHIIHFKVRED